MEEAPKIEKPADKIKVGFYQEEDSTFVAYVQFKGLPDVEAAQRCAEWIADSLLEMSKPIIPTAKKNLIIQ